MCKSKVEILPLKFISDISLNELRQTFGLRQPIDDYRPTAVSEQYDTG